MDKPIFCGNYEYDASERSIVELFEKYGRVKRIDMKTGFAFVYMEDDRDAKDAIRALDRMEFGYKRRPLRVEYAKKVELGGKDQKPTNTLFVVNFDVRTVREPEVERYFDRFGPITRVEIKRNYAFVEYRNVEDAVTAQKRTHGAMMEGRTITVEFVENRGGRENRPRSRSPYGGGARRRSPSPRGRSPPGRHGRRDHSPRRRSPSPPRRQRSRSPDYTRGGGRGGSRDRSPAPRRDRSVSPARGRSPRRSPMH